MEIKIGICGLPNSGKSTLVKLLSQIEVEIAPYPFTTLKPKEVLVPIISPELLTLHQVTQTPELKPPNLIFVDVPGLVKGAHRGEGLGNEFLSYLRSCQVVLEVVRNFYREDVPHPEGNVDPERDNLIIQEEINKSDEEILKRNKNKERGELNLLSDKKWYLLVNGKEIQLSEEIKRKFEKIYFLDVLWELEILEDEELKKEFELNVFKFLNQFRRDLDLIQFFTFNEKITQGWLIPKGTKVLEAVSQIHTDFALKFKTAEVINLEEFLEIKDWSLAHKMGKIKYKGKEAEVSENEIIFVKI